MNNRRTRMLLSVLLSGLVLTPPTILVAQDQPTFAPALMIITGEDGTESEYRVADFGAYVSLSGGYDGVPESVDVSLSLTAVSPIDAPLLEWSKHTVGSDGGLRALTIVSSAVEGEVRYEVTGADATSITFNHSNYSGQSVSLSVSAKALVVNGVKMN